MNLKNCLLTYNLRQTDRQAAGRGKDTDRQTDGVHRHTDRKFDKQTTNRTKPLKQAYLLVTSSK